MNLRTFLVVLVSTLLYSSTAFKLWDRLNSVERTRVKGHPKGFGTAKHAVIIGKLLSSNIL